MLVTAVANDLYIPEGMENSPNYDNMYSYVV